MTKKQNINYWRNQYKRDRRMAEHSRQTSQKILNGEPVDKIELFDLLCRLTAMYEVGADKSAENYAQFTAKNDRAKAHW